MVFLIESPIAFVLPIKNAPLKLSFLDLTSTLILRVASYLSAFRVDGPEALKMCNIPSFLIKSAGAQIIHGGQFKNPHGKAPCY